MKLLSIADGILVILLVIVLTYFAGYRVGEHHPVICHSVSDTDCLWVDGTATNK